MRVLVLCPMQREYDNFCAALKSNDPDFIDFKVVCCGVGKANAAVTASLEIADAIREKNPYDLVYVVGYAASSPFYRQGDFVVPTTAQYHDVHVPPQCVDFDGLYELQGCDPCTIFTGDSFVDAASCTEISSRFSTNKCLYDMEATAVCQVAVEYNTPVLVAKLVSDVPQSGDNLSSFDDFVNSHTDFSRFINFVSMLVRG